jgi:hypothetical protein
MSSFSFAFLRVHSRFQAGVPLGAFLALALVFTVPRYAAGADHASRLSPITVREGVLVHADGREVALWGVNYEFNLSWAYRTYFEPLGVPLTLAALKEIADRDFEELATLRAEIVRVHLLPADFTDENGNLVETVFLQALDYMVSKCREKGMYVYLSLFNRMGRDYRRDSFAARVFGDRGDRDREKSPYLFDPELLDAYERYVRQLIGRCNPQTGVRYCDEPAIAVWELMNEPEFPSVSDLDERGFERIRGDWMVWRLEHAGSGEAASFRNYRHARIAGFLERFYSAIREAGAQQPVFWSYNWPGFIQQHEEIASAVRTSRIDGVSFCLYPGQNDLAQPIDHRNLPSLASINYLPMLKPDGVDWAALRRTREAGKAVVVYEFETWCNDTAYLYPAMARLFRELGAQIACMWEYDPAIAAEYNFVPSHFLNLYTSPAKAASFLVGGEVFRRHPRARRIPDERLGPVEFRFGPFGASYSANTSWFVGDDTLLYSRGLPSDVATDDLTAREWRKIAGTGASPLIEVSGDGIYRLDRITAGYRLALFPDTELRGDLWKAGERATRSKKIVLRNQERRVVKLKLPGWTGRYIVNSPEQGVSTMAEGGQFDALPGIYVLEQEK